MSTQAFPTNPSLNLTVFTLLDRYAPTNISAKAKLYYCRYRSRHQLLTLNDERLADIGLTREQVLIETNLPFWK